MKTTPLIQALRRQALDDEAGVICCQPPEQVRTYFHLALDLAAPPEPVRALAARLEALAVDPSHVLWGWLFDFALEWAQSKKAPASSRQILTSLGRRAVHAGDGAGLSTILALYADCARLWPEGWTGFLPGLAHELRKDAPGREEQRNTCAMAILDAWEKEGLPAAWGPAVLQALRRDLARAPGGETTEELLEHLGDPVRLSEVWTAAWRRGIAQSDGRADLLAPILEEARQLLPLLQPGADYAALYGEAVKTVALSHRDLETALQQVLIASHPAPERLASLLALRAAVPAAWDPPSWRRFACALCSESNPARRLDLARAEIATALSSLLRTQPGSWSGSVRAAAGVLQGEFPGRAVRDRWRSEASTFHELSAAQVRALGEWAGSKASAAVEPWCALGESLGNLLRPADRRAWFAMGLELLSAAQDWNPTALADVIARWRGFVQYLLLSQSTYAGEANRILACQRETLQGPLYEACLALRPGQGAAELDTLHALGLGLRG